jgi:hypothetical protein
VLSRLRDSRKRLNVLARKVVVTPRLAERLADEAALLQVDLQWVAERASDESQRKSIEAMIEHAKILERRYTRQIASDEDS